MNLIDILKLKFLDLDFLKDLTLQDDGNGPYIKEWNLDSPQPTQEDLDQWALELEEEYQFQQNKIANEPIYSQLQEIDLKSIRALRSGDTERLASLEAEAQSLREQLLPTS